MKGSNPLLRQTTLYRRANPINDIVADFLCIFSDTVRGLDGTSCSHYWVGTTLYVTSASGTSAVDLKGEKGDSADLTVVEDVVENAVDDAKAEIETIIETEVARIDAKFTEYVEIDDVDDFTDEEIDAIMDEILNSE
jgi:hypothetical protein